MEEKKRENFYMQEENKKKSQLDAVKKSAGQVEIPDELRPQNLDEIIRTGREKKKHNKQMGKFLYRQR